MLIQGTAHSHKEYFFDEQRSCTSFPGFGQQKFDSCGVKSVAAVI